MNVKTAEQYLKRYRRIGARRAPKRRLSDDGPSGHLVDHAFRSKPNHVARVAALPLKPLGAKPRPQQPTHPATEPLHSSIRRANYVAQNGSGRLTPRQNRRLNHKWGRAIATAERAGDLMTHTLTRTGPDPDWPTHPPFPPTGPQLLARPGDDDMPIPPMPPQPPRPPWPGWWSA